MAKDTFGEDVPLLKRVLIPFYIVRIAACCFYGASLIWGMVLVNDMRHRFYHLWTEYGNTSAFQVLATLIGFFVVIAACLILDIVCVIKRWRRTLSHRFFLIANVIQTVVMLVIFVLMLVVGVRRTIDIAVSSVIFASYLGLLIYSIFTFVKQKKNSRYSSVVYESQPNSDPFMGHARTPSQTGLPSSNYAPYGQVEPHVGSSYNSYGNGPHEEARSTSPYQPQQQQHDAYDAGVHEMSQTDVPRPPAATTRLMSDGRP